MFSRKEKDVLAILAESRRKGRDPQTALAAAFPNPAYRRKLLWGIRQKASGAAQDLTLYLEAARQDRRVVAPARDPGRYPVAADPLVTLLRAVQGFVGAPPPKGRPKGRTPSGRGGRP